MSAIIKPFRGVWPTIDPSAFVADGAVIIGDVHVGAQSSIWYGCVLRGDVNRIRVGARANLQDGAVVHCSHDPAGDYRQHGGGMPTLIGDDVTVGHMALLHGCVLEEGCFVGMRAIVMDGAVVRSGGMLAAGALLTPGKVVEGGALWAGAPARLMRALRDEERATLSASARYYVALGERHRVEGEAGDGASGSD